MVCGPHRNNQRRVPPDDVSRTDESLPYQITLRPFELRPEARYGRLEQQDCSMLDWTSAANGALLVMLEAP